MAIGIYAICRILLPSCIMLHVLIRNSLQSLRAVFFYLSIKVSSNFQKDSALGAETDRDLNINVNVHWAWKLN